MKLEIGDRVKILSTKQDRLYLHEEGQIIDVSDSGDYAYIMFETIRNEWFHEDDLEALELENSVFRLEKRVTELEELIQKLIRKG